MRPLQLELAASSPLDDVLVLRMLGKRSLGRAKSLCLQAFVHQGTAYVQGARSESCVTFASFLAHARLGVGNVQVANSMSVPLAWQHLAL
eukprot:152497-Amphidinium_carterae.1